MLSGFAKASYVLSAVRITDILHGITQNALHSL